MEASCGDIINNGQVMKKLNSKEKDGGPDDVDMQCDALLLQKPWGLAAAWKTVWKITDYTKTQDILKV